MNKNKIIKGKKGFTFFLVAFAAIIFFVLLGFIWWTQIGEAGSSEIVQSACGKDAEYCTTTPELEILGFLKTQIQIGDEGMNLADALTLMVLDRPTGAQTISADAVKEAASRVFENECVYLISKNLEEIINVEKITGPRDCESVGAYSYIVTTIYRENNLIVQVAVGKRLWELYKGIITFILISTIT